MNTFQYGSVCPLAVDRVTDQVRRRSAALANKEAVAAAVRLLAGMMKTCLAVAEVLTRVGR